MRPPPRWRSARPAGTGWRCDRPAGPAAASRPTRAPSVATMPANRVCSPVRSTWTVTMPVRLWLPATTGCPSPRDKARDSPVSSASSTRVCAGDHGSVGGEHLARQHADPVAGGELAHRQRARTAVGRLPLDRLGHAAQPGLPATPAVRSRKPLLQQPPGQQEEDEHGDRVVPDLAAHGPVGIERGGGACAEGDEQPSATGTSMPMRLWRRSRQADSKNGRQENSSTGKVSTHEAQRSSAWMSGRDLAGLRHVGRRGVHHHLHHAKARDQPAPEEQPLRPQARHGRKQVGRRQRPVAGPLQGLEPVGRPARRWATRRRAPSPWRR